MAQINLSTKKKQTHRHREQNRLVVAEGKGEGSRIDGEFGVSRCKLLHLEWMGNEILL